MLYLVLIITVILTPLQLIFHIRRNHPPGKHMFVERSWNIPMRYSQYIQKIFPMKFRRVFRNNVPGILNAGIFPDSSMKISRMLHLFF